MSDEATPVAKRGANIFRMTGLTVGQFKDLAREMYIPELAARLGVSERCVQTWTKRLGVSHPAIRPKREATDLSEDSDSGAVAVWIKANPGKKLPRSPIAIAALVGCTPNAVKCWLRRRRWRYTRYCEALGDLREQPHASLLAIAADGSTQMRVPTRLLKAYSLRVNPRSLEVTVRFRLGVERTERRAVLALRAYYDLFQHGD